MACSCGHDHCSCQELSVLYLQDENGQAHPFYVGESFAVQERQYVLLQSAEDADQLALLKVVYDAAGNPSLSNITDESEWSAIEAALAAGSTAG
ncbi:DUF1292 domain-containing protein [Alicyclobacillus shizuokensis]|uniref:DUF1292 domain-containing protein n=1 Tax=Alicyclobacillus shizuokensis TaxID=392014 RepID=UPI000A4DD582|nr:DUF1292 domain-containing protein [Alicyclobacillus shizuokensis]MCL6625810.1 DUF1292 domain-containing protein [Alicyclobacillus shizuokensis]